MHIVLQITCRLPCKPPLMKSLHKPEDNCTTYVSLEVTGLRVYQATETITRTLSEIQTVWDLKSVSLDNIRYNSHA